MPAEGEPAATGPAASAEVVDLAADPAPDVVADDDPGTFGDLGDETPEPAGELRVVEIVTLGRAAGAVRSAA